MFNQGAEVWISAHLSLSNSHRLTGDGRLNAEMNATDRARGVLDNIRVNNCGHSSKLASHFNLDLSNRQTTTKRMTQRMLTPINNYQNAAVADNWVAEEVACQLHTNLLSHVTCYQFNAFQFTWTAANPTKLTCQGLLLAHKVAVLCHYTWLLTLLYQEWTVFQHWSKFILSVSTTTYINYYHVMSR